MIDRMDDLIGQCLVVAQCSLSFRISDQVNEPFTYGRIAIYVLLILLAALAIIKVSNWITLRCTYVRH